MFPNTCFDASSTSYRAFAANTLERHHNMRPSIWMIVLFHLIISSYTAHASALLTVYSLDPTAINCYNHTTDQRPPVTETRPERSSIDRPCKQIRFDR